MSTDATTLAKSFAAAEISDGYRADALYVYRNAAGELHHGVLRLEHSEKGKWIRPIHWIEDEPRMGLPSHTGPGPLYNLTELQQSEDPVVIVEGEKCADALVSVSTVFEGGIFTVCDGVFVGGRASLMQ
jgi:hypothetical protein